MARKYTRVERAKQGNPGRRPGDVEHPTIEVDQMFPDTPLDIPGPPAFLTDNNSAINEKAVEIWHFLAEYLHTAKMLRTGDAGSLGRLCRYIAEWDHLTNLLDAEGLVVSGSQGLQRHPAMLARINIESALVKLENKFGLNPDDRLSLTKDFANSLKNLPLANAPKQDASGGPIGFLKGKPE